MGNKMQHIEELTKGASQKSGLPNETDLLNSMLSHLVNQKTFMGQLLCATVLYVGICAR